MQQGSLTLQNDSSLAFIVFACWNFWILQENVPFDFEIALTTLFQFFYIVYNLVLWHIGF